MYAIANNYTIAGFKTLAVIKFKSFAKKAWNIKDFFDAVIKVYNFIVEINRDMRNAIV